MGCGASKESVAHSEPQPVRNEKQSTPLDGECSQLHQNFDCDPEDECASKAAKAVNLIARACSPTCEPEQDVEEHDEEDDCGNKDGEQEQEDDSKARREEGDSDSGATAAARDSSLLDEYDDDDEDDDDEDDSGLDGNAASSAVGNKLISAEDERAAEAGSMDEKLENLEGILSPALARSNNTSQHGRDREQQGVGDILPKAAKAALEAIVKSAEDDIQAHKVAAAMAAVGDILFGAKDDAEMKINKAEVAEGRHAADIRNGEVTHALNGEVETDAFPPSGTTGNEDEECSNEYSPKNGFLFDYCQKWRLNGYKVSSPPSTSISSEGDTISLIQDFLEEIDLTKELNHDPGTPRILFKDFKPAAKTTPFSFTTGMN